MTARQLAELVLEALETGDYGYIEALAFSALEDIDERESRATELVVDDEDSA